MLWLMLFFSVALANPFKPPTERSSPYQEPQQFPNLQQPGPSPHPMPEFSPVMPSPPPPLPSLPPPPAEEQKESKVLRGYIKSLDEGVGVKWEGDKVYMGKQCYYIYPDVPCKEDRSKRSRK